jgi:ferredoxin
LSESYYIEIDRDVCIGSGVCQSYASATFAIDDETKAAVIDAAGDPEKTVRQAAESCPTGAISIRAAHSAENS